MPHLMRQTGFSLIEVLITVFVVAVGLLSAAGLQVISKKNNYDALQRTTASESAQEILARMRANAGHASLYAVDDAVDAGTPAVSCDSQSCTPEQMASYDLWVWAQSLAGAAETDPEGGLSGGLSSPTACIEAGAGNLYTIAIAWRGVTPISLPTDDEDASDPANNGCGANKDEYQADADEGDVTYRRILVMQAYVSAPAAP